MNWFYSSKSGRAILYWAIALAVPVGILIGDFLYFLMEGHSMIIGG